MKYGLKMSCKVMMTLVQVLMDQLHSGQDPLGDTSDTSEVTTIIQKHGGVQVGVIVEVPYQ